MLWRVRVEVHSTSTCIYSGQLQVCKLCYVYTTSGVRTRGVLLCRAGRAARRSPKTILGMYPPRTVTLGSECLGSDLGPRKFCSENFFFAAGESVTTVYDVEVKRRRRRRWIQTRYTGVPMERPRWYRRVACVYDGPLTATPESLT